MPGPLKGFMYIVSWPFKKVKILFSADHLLEKSFQMNTHFNLTFIQMSEERIGAWFIAPPPDQHNRKSAGGAPCTLSAAKPVIITTSGRPSAAAPKPANEGDAVHKPAVARNRFGYCVTKMVGKLFHFFFLIGIYILEIISKCFVHINLLLLLDP